MNIRVYVQGMVCLICGLALLGSLVHAQKGEAATYYVDTDGSDSSPGTEKQPFQTLSRGVRELRPGDTLYVKNGTYTSWGIYDSPSGTSWDNPVTIAAYPGHSPVIVPNLYLATSRYMVIDGFVTGNITITWGFGGIADHIRVQNSELAYANDNGISVDDGSDGNEFINLQIHDNVYTGIYIRSSNNIVEDCSIHDNGGWGVHIYTGVEKGVDDNIIRDNTIYNNGRSGRGDGILLSSGTGNKAYGNIVWGNIEDGIRLYYGASYTEVSHNTIYDNAHYGIHIGGGSSNALIEANTVYNNGFLQIVNEGVSTTIFP
jgi:parallel beta-helix repeat protein